MSRPLAVICCAVLVALAGCAGGGPTTETAETTHPSPESPTSTAPASEESGLTLAVGATVELETLARAHAKLLENRSYTLRVDRRGGPRVTSVDGSGLARIDDTFRDTFFQTDEAAFRNRTEDGTHRYVARPATLNRSTGADLLAATSGGLVVTNTTTVEGETRYVLTPGIDYTNASGPRPYRKAVATESGLVTNYTSGTFSPDRGIDVVESFTVTDVGETTVEPPRWVSLIRDAPVAEATGTVVVEHPELDARLRVTDATDRRHVALRENENDWLAEGFVADAAVSPVVDPVVRDRSANATITVGYDESQLPAGANERNVSLFLYNETVGTYVQMNTTVDADADTATATRAYNVTYSTDGGPEQTIRPTINHPQGRPVVVVLHAPTYYQAWQNAG
ncbi:hypothetical protein ACFR9U_06680 [Halorientalis brevis]|uniref:Outer membrane lipoprotein-sorting protein n=1 Tax=Halorientalis brevis TaxID=1126241 RepID=A0ABD6CBR5_9EURY|nr:hypothetical protein [Halorientalis brevis]